MIRSHSRRLFGIAVLAALGSVGPTLAQWTQWGGPTRDFKVDGKGLAGQWGADGPKKLWTTKLGDGYSAVIVDGDRLYTMARRQEDEVVVALNADTGAVVWEHVYSAPYPDGLDRSFGLGPRSTPAVAGDRLITCGVGAIMHCLDKKTGKPVWTKDLHQEYGANFPNWGYASSPLIYKGTVIVPVGGDGQSMMAFKVSDGSVAWKSESFKNSYSSPILIKVDGQTQVVCLMAEEIAGFDPDNGKLFWSHPHKTQYNVNASTPLWGPDNLLFLSSAYDSGSRVLKLTQSGGKTSVEELWYSRKMRVHFGNAVRAGDVIYGSSGDNGPSFFAAVNVRTGEMAWRSRDFAKATLVAAGEKLILLDQDGQLLLAEPGGDNLKVLAKHTILGSVAWTVPTLVGTKLYARDREQVVALDLGA